MTRISPPVWSPSAAREAARADLCALRTPHAHVYSDLVAAVATDRRLDDALHADRAFDTSAAARELFANLEPQLAPKLAELLTGHP